MTELHPSNPEEPLYVAAAPTTTATTKESSDPDLPLAFNWRFYWHDRNDTDWSLQSYQQKAEFSTVPGFWRLYNHMRTVVYDMFFLMREGHAPIWEDPANVHGGALSFRIHNKDVDNFFLTASALLVGETICACPREIVGISVSPKVKQPTIRLWYRDHKKLKDLTSSLNRELLALSDDYIIRKHAK